MSLVEIACEFHDAPGMGKLRQVGAENSAATDAGGGDLRLAKHWKRLSQGKTTRALESRHL